MSQFQQSKINEGLLKYVATFFNFQVCFIYLFTLSSEEIVGGDRKWAELIQEKKNIDNVYIYIYIYIYGKRERERERNRDGQRHRNRKTETERDIDSDRDRDINR